jgi:ketosteroid isomerase-like protein
MAETNAERVRRGFEAVLRGDYDAIADLLDPDVKWHGGDPTAEGSCQNRTQALEWIRNARARGRLVDVVEAGDKVVVVIQPAGRDEQVANLTTFRDGKVVEMVHYPDPADALAAAGVR